MRKLLLSIILAVVCVSQSYALDYMRSQIPNKGTKFDTFKVLISSVGVQNATLGDATFISTRAVVNDAMQSTIIPGSVYDYSIKNTPEKPIWIDDNTSMVTSGNNEGRQVVASEEIRSNGSNSDAVYGRIRETLADWTTVYITIWGE